VQLGECPINRIESTVDIGSGGVRFTSPDSVITGCKMEYIVTLSGSNPPVRIRCLGKVLRSNRTEPAGPFDVAVTLERYHFLRAEQFVPAAAAVSA
jgi:hypothetical protein